MGCYIYDNFCEIQVVVKEDGDEDHGNRTINRKRGSRQWRSDIERR